MARTPTIAVIGGGFAGAATARELLRDHRVEVVLAEPSPRIGRGVAYGAAEPWHLLNSPAGAMSADPRNSGDFLDWLERGGRDAAAGDFLPRPVYGDYLQDTWDATAAAAGDRVRVLHDSAVRVRPRRHGVEIGFASGNLVEAEHVVVAVGNPASQGPLPRSTSGYVPNPWRLGALDGVEGEVLLIGTGLTAVDVLLSLRRRGHTAPVTAVSRHGLVPRAHLPRPSPARRPELGAESLPGLLREVREAAAGDWRPVVDGMRGDLDALWRGLGTVGRRCFIDHVARYWEVHRHRMAPAVAAEVDGLRHQGAWRIEADTVVDGAGLPDGGVEVRFGSGTVRRFGAVVNCTGPARLPSGGNIFVRRLLDEGLARTGPFRMGLDVDTDGRVIDARGAVHSRLWTIGALRRGVLWETTAVPEIRDQATVLARRLLDGVRPPARAAG